MTAPVVSFRRGGQPDVDLVAELEDLAFVDPWSSAMVRSALSDPSVRAWIADCSGGSVGFALFRQGIEETELLRLGVDPAWRCAGVGGELLARGLLEARQAGAGACFLEVRADNLPARRLYERLDFAIVGRRSGYYSDSSDAVVYRRALASTSG